MVDGSFLPAPSTIFQITNTIPPAIQVYPATNSFITYKGTYNLILRAEVIFGGVTMDSV